MSFFLPGRLIDFEYLLGEPDPEYDRIAKPYQKEIDFAFFAVNFGYSKSDYESMTPKEKAFIYKAWEEKIVSDSFRIYNAVFTAVYNVNRKKGKRALKLWKKAKVKKADMNTVQENMEVIKEVEANEGKSWINTIYRRNGMEILSRKEVGGNG